MGYENKDNGVLFAAAEKPTDDAPDSTGKLFIGEKEYALASWKLKQDGEDQLDLQFKAKGSSQVSADGDGSMQRTDKEGKSDKYPDWKGTIGVATPVGRDEYEIAGWKRTSKAGNHFLSLKISKPREPEPVSQAAPASATTSSEYEDFAF